MSVSFADHPSDGAFASFEIKSAQLSLIALMLKTGEMERLAQDLCWQFGEDGESPGFFDHDALVLDCSHLAPGTPVPDLTPLLDALRACQLVPVAVRGASAAWLEAARTFGLAEAPLEVSRARSAALPEPTPQIDLPQEIREVVHENPGPATMVVDRPLRSGQKVYARGADLVVLAMVNQGAEVVADGNIHVYAPLRGKAMAGASGNTRARIFSLCLEPELISIAGVYRTSEHPLAPEVHGKAAQVRLSGDGQDRLLFEALNT
jgi:septum site-determining protein MinC